MSKRDNPRLKQREADKQQQKESYFKQKSERPANSGKPEWSPKGGRPERSANSGKPEWAPKGGRPERSANSGKPEWAPKGGRPERSANSGKPEWAPKGGRPQRGGRPDSRPDTRQDKANATANFARSYGASAEWVSGQHGQGREELPENPNLIIGRNPVMEAVKSGRQIERLMMQKDGEGSIRKIASLARERKIVIQYVERIALDKLCPGRPHQGVAAIAAAHDYVELGDILAAAKEKGEEPFVIILDGLEDPHNLGAIMRTADAVGAHGIVIPARRAVGLTETVAKASAGAIEYVPVAKVGNIVSAIEELKKAGLWIAACDMDGQSYYSAELTGPMGIVVGGEGQGVSRLVREKCDYILSIPMKGKIGSLNASNAAAILMYEVYRRRDGVRQEG